MHGNKLKHIVALVTVLGMVAPTFSVGTGMYMGVQFGYGKNNQTALPSTDVAPDVQTVANRSESNKLFLKNSSATPPAPTTFNVVAQPIAFNPSSITSFSTKTHDNLFLGRFYVGYQFITWMGIELGFSVLSNTSLTYDASVTPAAASATILSNSNSKLASSGTLNGTYQSVYHQDITSQRAVDLFVKLSIPLFEPLNPYVKLGGAFIHSITDTELQVGGLKDITIPNLTTSYISSSSFTSKPSSSINTISPAIGLGLEYYFTPALGVDVTWYSIFVKQNKTSSGQTSNFKNNTNFFAVGLSYHMVAQYCGQFLCDD